MWLAYGIHFFLGQEINGEKKLQNSLFAGLVYVSAVALLYGFTNTVTSVSGKHTGAAYWGGGTTARRTVDVLSQAKSLEGGSGRHETFGAYIEGKTGGGTPLQRTGGATGGGALISHQL